jgi:hypothetical protein
MTGFRYAEKGLGVHGRRKAGLLGKTEREKILDLQHGRGWEDDPPGFRNFYEDPEKIPCPQTGKLEFYSEALAKAFPDDKERRPSPNGWKRAITMTNASPATGPKCSRC